MVEPRNPEPRLSAQIDQEVATEGVTAVDLAGPSLLDEQQLRRVPPVGGLDAAHPTEIGIDSIITGADHKLLATLDLEMDSNRALVQSR